MIARISQDPAFPIMVERLAEEFTRRAKMLTTVLIHGEEPADQRVIDFERGFIAGAQWFLREVAKRESQLAAENEEEDDEVE